MTMLKIQTKRHTWWLTCGARPPAALLYECSRALLGRANSKLRYWCESERYVMERGVPSESDTSLEHVRQMREHWAAIVACYLRSCAYWRRKLK